MEKFKDVLLSIGEIITADINDEPIQVMIIGTRAYNFDSRRAWDYIAVPYPDGYKTVKNETGYNNTVYFNHFDIYDRKENDINELQTFL